MSEPTVRQTGMEFSHRLSNPDKHPFEEVEWEFRDASIHDAGGNTIFFQARVRVPASWSQTATNIVASKYLHGVPDTPGREAGVDVLIQRVASTVTALGAEDGYFRSPTDAAVFERELIAVLLDQYAAFNSPVWFNVGCERYEPDNHSKSWHWDRKRKEIVSAPAGYRKPQCSACFINSVEDSMESILGLAKTEGMLFKWGSGTGTNFSPIRGSIESLSGGGIASGPLSFMRGYDAFAGAIKSGGKTRRAAKMAILDANHPDIEKFILSKGAEERKAQALIAAGYAGDSPDSEAYRSVFYQNANHSVRVTDEFMELAERGPGQHWPLLARTTGASVKDVDPALLLRKIAEEAWRCGDPGIQFDTTINSWHTCPRTGRINASNPCSEYMFLDNSACNLASLNLVKFVRNGDFDVGLYEHVIRLMIVAQEILVDHSGYPTKQIAQNSHDFRPLGLGYANVGALLMGMGLPYDSDAGRAFAGGLTSLMSGTAYRVSAEIAGAIEDSGTVHGNTRRGNQFPGAFPGYELNQWDFVSVIGRHNVAAQNQFAENLLLPAGLRQRAVAVWKEALVIGQASGYRNAQVTVLAPTGTIGFMMDCDTTGVEPDLALVKFKKLVGGGTVKIVNNSVPAALLRLRYSPDQADLIVHHIAAAGTIEGAPGLKEEHLPIFDCSFRPVNGKRSIHWRGHIQMMAAVQPFLSGAISKTINLPEEATVEDVEAAYFEAWRAKLKAVAIYRNGSKSSQPVTTGAAQSATNETKTEDHLSGPPRAVRHRLPAERPSITHRFSIGGHEGYLTVGFYPNGEAGELFLRMAKEGSTIAGLMECFGTAISVGLQHGVPLKVLCEKFAHTRFEPSGWTGNEEFGYAKSIMDYIFRWMDARLLSGRQLPPFSSTSPDNVTKPQPTRHNDGLHSGGTTGDAPLCSNCGAMMEPNGACHRCAECGTTSGACS